LCNCASSMHSSIRSDVVGDHTDWTKPAPSVPTRCPLRFMSGNGLYFVDANCSDTPHFRMKSTAVRIPDRRWDSFRFWVPASRNHRFTPDAFDLASSNRLSVLLLCESRSVAINWNLTEELPKLRHKNIQIGFSLSLIRGETTEIECKGTQFLLQRD